MALLQEFLETERAEILDHEIRLRAIGRVDRLPTGVRDVLDPLIRESAHHQGMTLSLALSYGGREEIANTARALAERVEAGELSAADIDLDMVGEAMPSAEVGPVDLLIRTGGEQRISNFLLWGAAYAELYFTDALWPNYTETDFYEAVAEYQKRNRRFGRVDPSPVEPPTTSCAPQKNAAI